jgi:hypothetical protein
VDRSERLIKLGDSWFSSKAIYVAPCVITLGGRALFRLGGSDILTKPMQTPNTEKYNAGDTRWVLTSIVKRETTQTDS